VVCYHCGLPIASSFFENDAIPFSVTIDGQARAMCCPGCQAVASAIVESHLSDFYHYRRQSSSREPSKKINELDEVIDHSRWTIYNLAEVQAAFVIPVDGQHKRVHLLLEGITCAACTWLIEHVLKKIPAVKSISVNATSHRCSFTWDESTALSKILAELARVGYKPRPATDEQTIELIKKENKKALLRMGVAGIGAMQAMLVAVGIYTGASEEWLVMLRWISLLVATPVVFYSAVPFFLQAWRSLRSKILTMDVPVALAIALAYAASVWATVFNLGEVYFESVSMFVFFLLLGRYVEMRARHQNKLAFSNLAQLMPLTACCLVNECDKQIEKIQPISSLKIGDLILVKSGDTFPCDGKVLDGESSAIESMLTGESLPVLKKVGDWVIAGTLNTTSPLQVQVMAVGSTTQAAAIEKLAAQAAADKPPQLIMADRLARFFIARLLIVCVLVFLFWWWYQPERALWITISVLVVTCPCALALAMPTAYSAAITQLRNKGFLITAGHVLETLTRVNKVILDKTGTLTKGQFELVRVDIFPGVTQTEDELLAIAAALEVGSNHPLAKAFQITSYQAKADSIRQLSAQGVEGIVNGILYRLGKASYVTQQDVSPPISSIHVTSTQTIAAKTWLLLASEKQPLAWIGLTDKTRPEAVALIQQLKKDNRAPVLISGDVEQSVTQLAQELGITHSIANASPADKLKQLTQYQQQGDSVIMLGDGINDVPVLAAADVSVAMASGSDLAKMSADVLLLSDNLSTINDAFLAAKKTKKIIQQNIYFSLVYNLVALPSAAAGLVPPWLAAIGMTTSSLIVVLNSLRLNK
jgi:P-type Cu2+ transporter